jgi:cell division protein FtsL
MIRHTTVLFILLAGALSLVLFTVKYQVQDLEHELKTLVRNIDANQRAIHVLNAEWSHLNNTDRLRRLAERHLGMQPIGADQLTRWPAFAARVPEAQTEIETEIPVSLAAKRNSLSVPLADRKADR